MFEQGLRVNTDGYTDAPKTAVKPWIEEISAGSPISLLTGFCSCPQGHEERGMVVGERSAPLEPRIVGVVAA